MHLFLFLLFGAFCAGGAVNLLLQRRAINSALSLIVVMGSLAMIYLLLGAEFVAVIQLIVYAGAIMVLFVFVIMLLNEGVEEPSKGSAVAKYIGIPGMLGGGILTIMVLLHNSPTAQKVTVGALYGPADQIGMLLFTKYLLPFEITSVLVLIAIMGAVVLARRSHT
jgi:NADH-quinone oxidoreductase subunit J